MKYTIRTLHNNIWGPTGVEVESRKEAKEIAEWGYSQYQKYKIVKATSRNLNRFIHKKARA